MFSEGQSTRQGAVSVMICDNFFPCVITKLGQKKNKFAFSNGSAEDLVVYF